MKPATTATTATTATIDFVAVRIASLGLFKDYGALERKSSTAKKAAMESAVAYMQTAKMDYEAEQQFKTDCILAQAGKGATPERLKTCRDSLNIALKLYPDYVAAIAATPKAQAMAKTRGGAKKAATNKASGKVAAIAKVIKGKSQSAPQVETPTDNIRADHIVVDVTRSMQGIHAHVQMHLKPSQLTDYNNAQAAFLATVKLIVAA